MGILRFLLAISVVLAHTTSLFGVRLVGGQIAVQSFYMISGFYMALILNEKYIGVNNSYKLFISNRFLRLYPIYWTVLILTVVYAFSMAIYKNVNEAPYLSNYSKYLDIMNIKTFLFLMFTNLFIFFQDWVMFLGLNTSTGGLFFATNFRETSPELYTFLFVPQGWTIGVELTFYLIAPFIVRKKLKTIILFIILSLLLRFILVCYGLKEDPWSHRFFPTELLFFMLGSITYKAYVKMRTLSIKPIYLKIIFAAVVGFTLVHNGIPLPYKYKYYMYIVLFFLALPFIFILTKKWKKDAFIGELSYPIYISHMLVIVCIDNLNIPKIGDQAITILIIIVTVLFAVLLNELVAKRIENIRQKRIMRTG